MTRLVGSEEIRKHVPELAEGERPEKEAKDAANAKLKEFGSVRIAGRLATPPRLMGKAAFVHLSDGISRLQIYVRRDDIKGVANDAENSEVNGWELFQLLDHGDFIGVEGFLFITNTGELSVHVERLQFLSKAMLPMPDKMHGIADAEIRQRQRYADLIGSSLQVEHEGLTTREVFEIRAKTISSLRRFLEEHGYIEVETPMLTPKATGAAAKPFVTHHNALDIDLYARIAPELYLKRLVVGGFEKVYELNRNFRNEGISYKHNPEFTMLEFYCAYMDVNGMMDFCEELFRNSVRKATGSLKVNYEGNEIDFSRFDRVAMREAIQKYAPEAEITDENIIGLFDEYVEPNLIQPTFIVDYPKSISPLSKASPENPQIAERFELFINGMECANGFSELNDPREQYERFLDQMRERERGDEEAMVMDEDYIRALSYGMPPAAGIGIGIDRLVMLLTNKHSIRDVILFPHLRPERKALAATEAGEEN
ncbi:MAG: lysine--tRNA ligase [Acidobacteriota bacterium]|nr:lysine--tRNA ligase [Acidobacteriota bacterium]